MCSIRTLPQDDVFAQSGTLRDKWRKGLDFFIIIIIPAPFIR